MPRVGPHRKSKSSSAAPQDFAEFALDLDDYRQDTEHNIGNLTCVLSKLKMLDAKLNVNIDFLTSGMWDEVGYH